MEADWLTLLLACLSGAANGTFPVFIKTDAVLQAKVHPIVFQLYKSSWVMIIGVACALIRLARGLSLEFTKWAFWSAAAWIPSGVFTIIAVPLIGMGSSVLMTSAIGSALSFLVFWLGFHEDIKVHVVGGHKLVFAPYFLLGCLVGMAGLVLAHQASLRAQGRMLTSPTLCPRSPLATGLASDDERPSADEASGSSDEQQQRELVKSRRLLGRLGGGGVDSERMLRTVVGYVAAAISGVFSSLQYGVVEYGRRQVEGASPPGPPPSPHLNLPAPPDAPPRPAGPDERFDALGSWLAAFGVSAVACTLFCYVLVAVYEASNGRPSPPSLHPRVMLFAGSGAGIFWSLANICGVLAVLRGGQAVTIAQINAASLISSGLWGLLYYREIRGPPAVQWVLAAAFTAAMTVMLGFEKAK